MCALNPLSLHFSPLLTLSMELRRSPGSFRRVSNFFFLPATSSKIVRPSQITPIAVWPDVRQMGMCVEGKGAIGWMDGV